MSATNLLKISLVCVLLMSGSTVLADRGQPGGPGGGRGQRPQGGNHPPALPDSSQIVEIVEQTAQSLALDDEQTVLVSDLYFAHFAEAGELMDEGGDQRKQMDALRQDFEEEVKALLDEDQKAEFEELVKNQGKKSGQRGQRRN